MSYANHNPHAPRRPRCRKCRKEIIFIRHAQSGKSMPCDPQPVESNGFQTLIVRDEAGFGLVKKPAAEGVIGYVSHFAICPYAGDFRKVPKHPASPAAPSPPPDDQLRLPL